MVVLLITDTTSQALDKMTFGLVFYFSKQVDVIV